MSQAGLSAILSQIAQSQRQAEKRAFVPMPGGEAAPAPAGDPAAGAMGGMPPGVDPMMMAAAQGMPPAEMMAAQGAPVDPAMAMAAGTPVDPAAAGAAPAGAVPPEIQAAIDQAVQAAVGKGGNGGAGAGTGGKAKADERLAKIESMLSQVLGVLVGRGELPEAALEVNATESEAPAAAAPDTAAPTSMGEPAAAEPAPKLAHVSPVPEKTEKEELQQARSAAQSMAELLGRLASR